MAAKKPMTKSDIVNHFSKKFELNKRQAKEIIDEYSTLAASQTKKVGSFMLPGLGKLTKVKRKARKGRNPATGEVIKIPAKTVVKMRLTKTCSEAIVGAKKK